MGIGLFTGGTIWILTHGHAGGSRSSFFGGDPMASVFAVKPAKYRGFLFGFPSKPLTFVGLAF